MPEQTVLVWIAVGVLIFGLLVALATSRYHKVGPNKVMIIYGQNQQSV